MRTLEPTDLLGEWRLDRRVVDRAAGEHGRMRGTLSLTGGPDAVHWLERGAFRWAGQTYEASRRLVVRRGLDGWTVCFADGREFHPWRPGSVVIHPCRADTYRGLVDATPTRLRTLWDVTGPTTDQRLVTRCVRTG